MISFDRVTYTYAGASSPALVDVSFAVEPGEFVVVAGLSGSGKSTVVRAACGLVPHFHGGEFGGRVVVEGLDTREHGPGEIAAVAGTLAQDPETQVVLGTVRAELAFPLENRGHGAAAIARGVEEAALALGIAHLLDRQTSTLSGGELQRVALAGALAGRPQVVLLDEPTSQLDPVAGDELVWLLRRLNEEWGTTVVLVEHRLERCLPAADRVLAFDRGRLGCDAPPRAFLEWAAAEAPPLETPAARLLARAGLRPPPTGVKEARATLRAHGLLPDEGVRPLESTPLKGSDPGPGGRGRGPLRRLLGGGRSAEPAALRFDGVWHELKGGRALLRGVDLVLRPGERVALVGRNGAGKSTLLRHAAGLLQPTRGTVEAAGRVALLLQNPNDYLLHERVGDEAPAAARAAAGLDVAEDRHPRDLSGGERERLALAVVLGADASPPAAVCLDEPTRGLDRAAKDELAARLRGLADAGSAVLVAVHDPEFAAVFAERVVLLADGRPIADGSTSDVLAGGWYFATETARVLGGAGGALLPDEGADLLLRTTTAQMTP
ncbi:MAG TPA: ATP-binding cassette domain-containing protein [Solirubrobacteraceae bacterium]|nr:ATP-binding cassette domain-containing protein [Solirubrobacteraceae bacterium]